jgi:hypothetical protein
MTEMNKLNASCSLRGTTANHMSAEISSETSQKNELERKKIFCLN